MENHIFYKDEWLKIINEDVLWTHEIGDNSIDLIVTSPPYNVDIKYNTHNDKLSYKEYLEFSRKWLTRCYGWLKGDELFHEKVRNIN